METKQELAVKLFDKLVIMLNRELEQYIELEKIILKKQYAVVKNDIDVLKVAVHNEVSQTEKCQETDRKREEIVFLLGKIFPVNKEKPSLSDLLKFASNKQSIQLSSIKSQLKNTVLRIDRLNQQNKYLLDISIGQVQNLIQLFLQASDQSNDTYSNQGKVRINDFHNKVLNYQI